MAEIVNIDIYPTIEEVSLTIEPNLITINVNTVLATGAVTSVNGMTGAVILNIPDTADFVPYAGAIQDLNLGEFGVQLGNIEFDLTPTNAPITAGSMVWNDTDGTLDLKLKGGAVTLQVGQETVKRVVNKTGADLLESQYKVVRIRTAAEGGSQGQRSAIVNAQANTNLNSNATLGVVTESILNNQEGFITLLGEVRQINTTGSLQGETWLDGDQLFLSATIEGGLTKIVPASPYYSIPVATIDHAHAINGKLSINVGRRLALDVTLSGDNDTAPSVTAVRTYVSNRIKSIIKDTVQGSTITGVTTEVLTGTYLIPANTFASNDIMKITSFLAEKTGVAGTCTMKVKIGPTNVFSAATLIGVYITSTTSLWCIFQRMSITLRGGVIKVANVNSGIQTDINAGVTVVSSINFNPAVNNYIFTSLQLANATDSVFQSNFIMTN